MQLGDSQLVLEYLKCYYKGNYNENHEEISKKNIEPIKSKIPLPPVTGGKVRMTPIDAKKHVIVGPGHDDNYDSIREQEQEYRDKMTYHFGLASKAFRRGDRAMAKREATEGKKFKNLFLQERFMAMNRTLASKNQNLNRAESIDLHGLHGSEVSYIIDNYINDVQEKLVIGEIIPNQGAKRGHLVTMITGKGNNSRGGKSVIKEEVRNYLRGKNIGFKESDGYFTISIV